jgi:hypothetical protein
MKPQINLCGSKYPEPNLFKKFIYEQTVKVSQQQASNIDHDLGSGKFAALADRIVNNLKLCNIISLQEIQDNTRNRN